MPTDCGPSTEPDGVIATLAAARTGSTRAIARLLSWVEQGAGPSVELARTLLAEPGDAQIVGITGPPGVGKSTTTAALITAYRRAGRRVGVIAVDPSSPFSGGALLGDRIRMGVHATDPGVFLRSMAARGQLGGLAAAIPQSVRVLASVGFDLVLIETVGVGQSELDIARLADTTVVVLAPGAGDAIQAAKAGIIEIADVLVVNKGDREGAERTARDLGQIQSMSGSQRDGWTAPILRTVASQADGIDELGEAIHAHFAWLGVSGHRQQRRTDRVALEAQAIAMDHVRRKLKAARADPEVIAAVESVAAGTAPVHSAAEVLRRVADRLGAP